MLFLLRKPKLYVQKHKQMLKAVVTADLQYYRLCVCVCVFKCMQRHIEQKVCYSREVSPFIQDIQMERQGE